MIQAICHRGLCMGICLWMHLWNPKPWMARQPAKGIAGPVPPGEGPLQPVPRALILLGNHFPPTGSSLVNSFQSWLTQGRAMFPPRSGQHLLRSSIIIWQLISARNPLPPPLAFRSHIQWPLARLALNMLLFPNFPSCLFIHSVSTSLLNVFTDVLW